jgi:hypothetical protein
VLEELGGVADVDEDDPVVAEPLDGVRRRVRPDPREGLGDQPFVPLRDAAGGLRVCDSTPRGTGSTAEEM